MQYVQIFSCAWNFLWCPLSLTNLLLGDQILIEAQWGICRWRTQRGNITFSHPYKLRIKMLCTTLSVNDKPTYSTIIILVKWITKRKKKSINNEYSVCVCVLKKKKNKHEFCHVTILSSELPFIYLFIFIIWKRSCH